LCDYKVSLKPTPALLAHELVYGPLGTTNRHTPRNVQDAHLQ